MDTLKVPLKDSEVKLPEDVDAVQVDQTLTVESMIRTSLNPEGPSEESTKQASRKQTKALVNRQSIGGQLTRVSDSGHKPAGQDHLQHTFETESFEGSVGKENANNSYDEQCQYEEVSEMRLEINQSSKNLCQASEERVCVNTIQSCTLYDTSDCLNVRGELQEPFGSFNFEEEFIDTTDTSTPEPSLYTSPSNVHVADADNESSTVKGFYDLDLGPALLQTDEEPNLENRSYRPEKMANDSGQALFHKSGHVCDADVHAEFPSDFPIRLSIGISEDDEISRENVSCQSRQLTDSINSTQPKERVSQEEQPDLFRNDQNAIAFQHHSDKNDGQNFSLQRLSLLESYAYQSNPKGLLSLELFIDIHVTTHKAPLDMMSTGQSEYSVGTNGKCNAMNRKPPLQVGRYLPIYVVARRAYNIQDLVSNLYDLHPNQDIVMYPVLHGETHTSSEEEESLEREERIADPAANSQPQDQGGRRDDYFSSMTQESQSCDTEQLHFERLRVMTFRTYTGQGFAPCLAQNGFYLCCPDSSETQCYCCRMCLVSDWQPFDDVAERHRHLSPNCAIVLQLASNNIPIRSESSAAEANRNSNRNGCQPVQDSQNQSYSHQRRSCHRTRHPEYSSLVSFRHWPQDFNSLRAMAEAGFFYRARGVVPLSPRHDQVPALTTQMDMGNPEEAVSGALNTFQDLSERTRYARYSELTSRLREYGFSRRRIADVLRRTFRRAGQREFSLEEVLDFMLNEDEPILQLRP